MPDTDPLLRAAIVALTPAFLPQADNDTTRAYQAARTAILSHNPTTGAEALLAAQAIAFDLAALQAAAEAITTGSTPAATRAVVSLARSAERCRRALDRRHPPRAPKPETPAPAPAWTDTMADTVLAELAAEFRSTSRATQNVRQPVPPHADYAAALRRDLMSIRSPAP